MALLKTTSVKTIAETPNLLSIPSTYIFPDDNSRHAPVAPNTTVDPILIIDFSLLTAGTPDQRSKVVNELGKACRDWGFFMVINHGVSETLMKEMMKCLTEFFDLTEEEKREYETKHVLDPIRYGTSFNPKVENVLLWRDYLKILVHPIFHSPSKPPAFREISQEYCKRIGEMTKELLRGISESLGLEPYNIEKAMNLDLCSKILIGNLYPQCPQPHLAMGLPPHSDHCLLAILMQNDVGGLQILHDNNWINITPIPNSFLVNTADQLEIFSNGKNKSVLHRAILNEKATRISAIVAVGPSLDTIVAPSPQLIDEETNPPLFKGIKYQDFLQVMQSSKLHEKSSLDRIRLT